MKKNFKALAGVGLALTMAVAGVVSSYAKDSAITLSGDISEASLAINVTIPTTGSLVVKPYSANQIGTGAGSTITTNEQNTDVAYKVSLAGYTAVLTPKTTTNMMSLSTTYKEIGEYDATSTKKEISLKIVAEEADEQQNMTQPDSGAGAYIAKQFDDPAIDVTVTKTSTATYDGKTNTLYTKVESAANNEITLDSTNNGAAFAVVGTMNPNATWEAGDKIVVTPIFKVTPTVVEDTTTTTTT